MAICGERPSKYSEGHITDSFQISPASLRSFSLSFVFSLNPLDSSSSRSFGDSILNCHQVRIKYIHSHLNLSPKLFNLIIRQPGIFPDFIIRFAISYHLKSNFSSKSSSHVVFCNLKTSRNNARHSNVLVKGLPPQCITV